MRLDITGRHIDITPALRDLIDKRLVRLGKLLNEAAISAQVILTKEKYRHSAEIVVHARGDRRLRGQGEGDSWPIALKQASDKIAHQAETIKGKWGERKRQGASARTVSLPREIEPAAGPPARRIIRARRYAVKPMSVEDAAMQVDGSTENFVVFRNADTEAVSILYKRKDGHFGLIEPD